VHHAALPDRMQKRTIMQAVGMAGAAVGDLGPAERCSLGGRVGRGPINRGGLPDSKLILTRQKWTRVK